MAKTKTPEHIDRGITLSNRRAKNPRLPEDKERWYTRDDVWWEVPDDYNAWHGVPQNPDIRREMAFEFQRERGLPIRTIPFRVTLNRIKERKPENQNDPPGLMPPYECFAVDESEAILFAMKTYGYTDASRFRGNEVVRLT